MTRPTQSSRTANRGRSIEAGNQRNNPGYYGAFVLDPDGHNVEVVKKTTPAER
jgi:hypothetical protein